MSSDRDLGVIDQSQDVTNGKNTEDDARDA
jgi:hypothetical protein